MSTDFLTTPDDLPVPSDDGGADHLIGMSIPDIQLPTTKGGALSLQRYADIIVLYIYPMTGVPGTALPDGWDDMPGARGCTPQSCALRDAYDDIRGFGAELVGLSSQSPEYQSEMALRLGLTFPILSDAAFAFSKALNLPSFALHEVTYLKRLTMIIRNDVIEAVHYPVFPSTSDPAWLTKMLPKILS